MASKGKWLLHTVLFFILVCLFLAVINNVLYFISVLSEVQLNSCKCSRMNDWHISEKNLPISELSENKAIYSTTQQTRRKSTKELQLRLKGEEIQERQKWIDVEAQSDRKHVFVAVNEEKVYEFDELIERDRGLHVIVLSQYTGEVMTSMVFDFYGGAESIDLVHFLNSLKRGRLVVFLIKDEGGRGFNKIGRNAIKNFGSRMASQIGFRDHWVCIGIRGNDWVSENISKYAGDDKWPPAVRARVSLKLSNNPNLNEICNYSVDEDAFRWKVFCKNHDGYGSLCDCSKQEQLYKKPSQIGRENLVSFPVVIIASRRPHYLLRMLRKLLSVPGADPRMMTVFIDGFYRETKSVAELFDLKVIINEIKCKKNCRIQQHYKKSLSLTFDTFPSAKAVIILEDDLEVSDDIFDYFSQTFPLFVMDPSIYCISAWNDQGYQHSVNDSSLLYRVETMPGLGWLLSRNLYKNELEAKWPGPNDYWDWDIWMRMDHIRKGRECIIPDVSRTYHFGAKGLNVDISFQKKYFKRRALNMKYGIKFDVGKMKKKEYEEEVHRLLRSAHVLNFTKASCESKDDIVPDTTGKVYSLFIKMEKNKTYATWTQIAKCLEIWDLDARDFHNGMIRFWIKGNHIIVIGVPNSNYASYKPNNIKSVEFKKL